MKRFLTLLCLMVTMVTGAWAANVDLGAVETDKTYTFASGSNVSFEYTATDDGTLTVTTPYSYFFVPYKTSAHTYGDTYEYTQNNGTPRVVTMNVTKGTTYYFYRASCYITSVTLHLTASGTKQECTLETATPALNGTYNMTEKAGQLQWDFNAPVQATKATLAVGETVLDSNLPLSYAQNGIYTNSVQSKIWQAYKDGTAKEGDEMTITITGICLTSDNTSLYGEDGTLTAKYTLGDKPVTLKSSENFTTNSTFKSYYASGAEGSVVKLQFDGKVSLDKVSAELRFGDIDKAGEDEYNTQAIESSKITLSDDKTAILLDLSGVDRRQSNLLPDATSGVKYTTIYLQVSGVTDANGFYTYSEGQGSLGSYGCNYAYDDLSIFKITSSNPAADSECAGFPSTGTSTDRYWTFTTSYDDNASLCSIQYEFKDLTTGTSLYTSNFARSGKWNQTGFENMWSVKNFSANLSDFKKGHKIQLKIEGYDNNTPSQGNCLGKDSIQFIGAGSAEYEYSPATLVSIAPTPMVTKDAKTDYGTELTAKTQNTFVLTFSQAVELDKTKTAIVVSKDSQTPFKSITASEDKKVWTLVAKESSIESATPALQFNVYAKDADGKVLEGNTSGAYKLEDASYYKFKYICYLGSPATTITPTAGQVTSLKDFKVAYSAGINYSYANCDSITVANAAGEVVAKVSALDKDKCLNFDDNNTYCTFSLHEAITTPGKYTLTIPSKVFALGTEFDGYTSKLQTVEYTVAAEALKVTSTDPADKAELAKFPELLTVTFNNPDAVGYANYNLVDNNADDPENNVVLSGYFAKNKDNTFTSTAGKWGVYKLYTDHTYTLKIKTWGNVDDYNYGNPANGQFDAATWKGTAIPYAYSAVTYESTNPADQSTIKSGEFTVTFSGAVASLTAAVNGGLSGETACETTSIADGKTWTVTIPESVIKSVTGTLNVNLKAKDAEGKEVKGNTGEDPDLTYQVNYNCYEGAPEFTISPADGSTVEEIKTITCTYSGKINPSWLCNGYVYSGKAIAAQFSSLNVSVNSDNTVATVTLPEAITAAGTYQVVFPATFFALGEQFTGCSSKEQSVELTIEGAASTGINVTPAAGKVTSLKDFIFTYNSGEVICPCNDNTYNLTITNASGTTVATITQDMLSAGAISPSEWADPTEIDVSLGTAITEPGTYTLTMPAGAFQVGSNYDNSELTTVTWTIESAGDVKFTADPADGATVASISKITFTFTDAFTADHNDGKPTITNAAGESASIIVEYGYGNDYNQLTVECAKITAAGTYTITLPAGSVILDNTPTTKDITMTLTVAAPAQATAKMYVRHDMGCATFCAPFDVKVPEDVKAYTADEVVDNSWIKMTEVTTIPAYTSVVVKYSGAEDFSKDFTAAKTEGSEKSAVLVGNYTDEVDYIPANSYILQSNNGVSGWFKVEEANSLKVGPNRCYMIMGDGARSFYGMNFDGTTTGISNIAAEAQSMKDGKYLVNGKFVIVKSGKAYGANGVQY